MRAYKQRVTVSNYEVSGAAQRLPLAPPMLELHEPAAAGVATATGAPGAFFFALVLLVETAFLAGAAFFAALLSLAQRAF